DSGRPRRDLDPPRHERPRLRRDRKGPGPAGRHRQVPALPGPCGGRAPDPRAARVPGDRRRPRIVRDGRRGSRMSCRELERLFVAGGRGAQIEAHRRSCPQCEVLARDVERVEGLTRGLVAPAWSPLLRQSLLSIPQMTVGCEGAALLLAERAEGELRPEDAKRLESHLSRCEGCAEAAGVLDSAKELVAPATPPWLTTRLAAVRPVTKKHSKWRMFVSGRAFIAYAYAAALAVMLLGWNPTAVVRSPGFARLGVTASQAVTVARSSVGDRLGA